ncbi:MAG: hypothetical protein ACYCZF_10650 [Anaerolineae bacterium]
MKLKWLLSHVLGLIVLSIVLAVLVSLAPSRYSTSQAAAPVGTLISEIDPYTAQTPVPRVPGYGVVTVDLDPGTPDTIFAYILSEHTVSLFHLHGRDFIPGDTVEWVIKTVPADAAVLNGTIFILEDGTGQTRQLNLPDGHYIVYWRLAGYPGDETLVPFTVRRSATDPVETSTPSSEPGEINNPGVIVAGRLAQVSVACHGCWSSFAQVWVGGTEQPSQGLAPDAEGSLAALWTFWNTESWQIRVRVTLPAELDPNRWKLILWVGTGPADYIWADEVAFTLVPHQQTRLNFQLVDTLTWQ